jgi:stalled ribosome rescue protein Dom34
MHADLYRDEGGELTGPIELHAEWPAAEATDVGVSNRASTTSGVRGTTRGDYAKRTKDENMRRHRKNLEEALAEMAGDEGVIVLGGTQKAISAVRRDLEDAFPGRLAEDAELAFDSSPDELLAHVRGAASRLTEERQARFMEDCGGPGHGCGGWNETYRALAAGAVDKLLLARELIESTPDDAERLVRLALAQGAEVEEAGGSVSERLAHETGGVASRLRFVPASLIA